MKAGKFTPVVAALLVAASLVAVPVRAQDPQARDGPFMPGVAHGADNAPGTEAEALLEGDGVAHLTVHATRDEDGVPALKTGVDAPRWQIGNIALRDDLEPRVPDAFSGRHDGNPYLFGVRLSF